MRALSEQVGLEFVDLSDFQSIRCRLAAPRDVGRAATARSRSASATTSCSSPCPTRRTSTRSTTSARSRAAMCNPSSRRPSDMSRRSSKFAALDGQLDDMVKEASKRVQERRRRIGAIEARRGRADRQARQPRSSPRRSPTARPTSTSSRNEQDVRVRFRIDGVLHEVMQPPKNVQDGLRQPPQGHGRPQHRREARAPGRPDPMKVGGKASTCALRRCRRSTARRS